MKIIPNNLKRMYDLYAPEYEKKALEVLRSGWYILGREVEHFEKEFKRLDRYTQRTMALSDGGLSFDLPDPRQ